MPHWFRSTCCPLLLVLAVAAVQAAPGLAAPHVAGVQVGGVQAGPAGPLSRSWVAPEARWVFHVDMQRLHHSTLLSEMRARGDSFSPVWRLMANFQAETGLDPAADLISLTLYGSDYRQRETVTLLHTSERLDSALTAMLRELPPGVQHDIREVDELRVHELRYTSGQRNFFVIRTPTDAPQTRVAVFASSATGAVRAGRILDGSLPSHATEPQPILPIDALEGAMMYLSCVDMERMDAGGHGPRSTFLKHAQEMMIEFREHPGRGVGDGSTMQSGLRAVIRTADAGHAADLAELMTGSLAAARLRYQGNPESPELAMIRAVRVETEDRIVRLRYRQDSVELVAALADMLSQLHDSP